MKRWPLGNIPGYRLHIQFKNSRCSFGLARIRDRNRGTEVSFTLHDEDGRESQESHLL